MLTIEELKNYVLEINLHKTSMLHIQLLDISGKIFGDKTQTFLPGNNHFPINLSSYSSGVYYCRVNGERINTNYKLIQN